MPPLSSFDMLSLVLFILFGLSSSEFFLPPAGMPSSTSEWGLFLDFAPALLFSVAVASVLSVAVPIFNDCLPELGLGAATFLLLRCRDLEQPASLSITIMCSLVPFFTNCFLTFPYSRSPIRGAEDSAEAFAYVPAAGWHCELPGAVPLGEASVFSGGAFCLLLVGFSHFMYVRLYVPVSGSGRF